MNVKEDMLEQYGYTTFIDRMQGTLARTFGACEVLLCTDTYQFSDYGKYLSTVWDAQAKAKRREETFPQDLARAVELGARMAAPAAS